MNIGFSAAESPQFLPITPEPFGYLDPQEVALLSRVFESAGSRRESVLHRWYRLYVVQFEGKRILPYRVFSKVLGDELDAVIEAVRTRQFSRLADGVRKSTTLLRKFRMPFSEAAMLSHFLQQTLLTLSRAPQPECLRICRCLNKLGCGMAGLIAETYFESSADGRDATDGVEFLPENLDSFRGMIGVSPPMNALYRRIAMAANAPGTILIVGESGTGKELVARALHDAGLDPEAPFVALNCAALPKDLIESELFGYVRGAFSGARDNYLGLFRAAEGGTLFLDEITEMGVDVQSKLLRSLQEKTVRPVGSEKEVPVSARVIASTNRDPQEAVRSGTLRADLYYRLQANFLSVPPLRERRTDIGLLVKHFLGIFTQNNAGTERIQTVSDDALEALGNYWWPGNVRELANAIESAVTFGHAPAITAADLPAAIFRPDSRGPDETGIVPGSVAVPTYAEVEHQLFARALEVAQGNRLKAARMLGVSRKKLYDKIAKYGLA